MSCYYRSGWNSWPRQTQNQDQAQLQAQAQAQAQEAEQDQNQRTIFREIGNVHIDIDNENILVAVLVVVAFLSGALDGPGVQTLLDRVMSTNAPAR